jgi:hypothetical protein
MKAVPEPRFDHLIALSTMHGVFAQADGVRPRGSSGYRLEDAAKGLIVAAREPAPDPALQTLELTFLLFVLEAQDGAGTFRSCRSTSGTWPDGPSAGEHWGRALQALAVEATRRTGDTRDIALFSGSLALGVRSASRLAMGAAAIGAGDILQVRPGHLRALALLGDARRRLGFHPERREDRQRWPWRQARVGPRAAVLPHALLCVGEALGDGASLDLGLEVLGWLVDLQMADGRLQPLPARGWSAGEPLPGRPEFLEAAGGGTPGYEQRPGDVAALADAAARAYEITGASEWHYVVDRAAQWFLGDNARGEALYDAETGSCADSLGPTGPSPDRGAGATLSALSTLQLAHRAASIRGLFEEAWV